jgi:hypothetical protein
MKDINDPDFDRMLDEHFSKDSSIKQGIKSKLLWDSKSIEQKKEFGVKITQGKTTISKEVVEEIWMKVWGEDRGLELYSKLAKEYNTSNHIIMAIAGGDHVFSPVNKEQWKKIHSHWHNLYGYNKYRYIVRSPGNDLLDYYNIKNLQRGIKTSKLSPSEIFNIRFRWKDNSVSQIKKYCLEKGIKVDGSMYSIYRDKTFSWLVDKPHQSWEFDDLVKMSQWMMDRSNKPKKIKGGQWAFAYLENEMIWMDRGFGLNGWSFIREHK